jgi:hypothetical protein
MINESVDTGSRRRTGGRIARFECGVAWRAWSKHHAVMETTRKKFDHIQGV